MPYLYEHGGGCCGRCHLSGFDHQNPVRQGTIESFHNRMGDFVEKYVPDEDDEDFYEQDEWVKGMCVEITLTDYQCGLKDKDGNTQRQIIEEQGFKEVFAFINPNTENTVRVFMYSSAEVPINTTNTT